MVATQSFSISRRTLDVEDYIDILRRHVGWIVGPAFFGMVVSICVAFVLPNQYTSKATMEIQPAQISESMVQSTISNSLNERIQQMETQILSRTNLSAIMMDPRNQLYKEELKNEPPEDVIEKMKSAINIQFVTLPGALGKRASAFDISFSYSDRYRAKQTVEALMNKFEEENQNTQKTDQDAVTGFVSDLLQHAHADLQDAQDKLTAFKEGNAGKLPDQVGLNIARENGYTEKIRNARDQIFRDQAELDNLATARSQAKARLDFYNQEKLAMDSLKEAPVGSPAAEQDKELAQVNKTVETIESNIQQLRLQYSDTYPQVKAALKTLELWKQKQADLKVKVEAREEAAAAKAAADAAKPKEPKTSADLQQIKIRNQVDVDLADIDLKEKHLTDDITRVKAAMATYEKESEEVNQMLKDSTGIEAQYEDLVHNKQLAEESYLDLLKKQQLAEANKQLIERKAGEILDVLDPASLPVQPTKPNRYYIIGSGFAMSMILGIGMAGLQEAKDTSLKNLKDVRAYTNLPVLCSIPLLENTMLVKRKKRLTYLAWAAAVIVGAAAVSASVVYYFSVTMKT